MSPRLSQKPNIVLVHGHDIGRYLGCYGYRIQTPNIDTLAADGVRFDTYFCPAPQCSPSRASMITGRYPHNNGMMGLAHLDWHLNDPSEALPHQLKRLGYETYLFGEQHEASSGEILGYDKCYGTKWPQLARDVAPTFADFLGSISGDKPFFASVGFFEAHRPFDHPGYEDDSPDEVEVLPYLPDTPKVRQDIASLQGRIKAVDDGVGTILTALEKNGLEGNTLLIFTTDHGIAFPRAKGTLYDTGLEVAFIIRWPNEITPSEPRKELVCNVDLVPTLLEAVGADPANDLDGQSFLPLLKDEPYQPREHFMCEMTWHDRYVPMRGMRTGRWKYIKHFHEESSLYLPADVDESASGQAFRSSSKTGSRSVEELYDLNADPYEFNNLIDDRTYSQVADELRQRVDQWMQETSDPLLRETS